MTTWEGPALLAQHVGEVDGTKILVDRYDDGAIYLSLKRPGERTWGPSFELPAAAIVQMDRSIEAPR